MLGVVVVVVVLASISALSLAFRKVPTEQVAEPLPPTTDNQEKAELVFHQEKSTKCAELHSRLKSAGANFSTKKGTIAISLMWDHSQELKNDLDLHVMTPSKEKIYYRHKMSRCGGKLDVDRQQDASKPVENIVWAQDAPKGTYTVRVHNYSANHSQSIPFQVGIVIDGGDMELIEKTMPGGEDQFVEVKTFEYKSAPRTNPSENLDKTRKPYTQCGCVGRFR